MTGIVVLIFLGFFVYGYWHAVGRVVSNVEPKCSVCGSTTRTLEWVESWGEWYCWPCKEQCIHAILDTLTGEPA
jgi:hypothetical protein